MSCSRPFGAIADGSGDGFPGKAYHKYRGTLYSAAAESLVTMKTERRGMLAEGVRRPLQDNASRIVHSEALSCGCESFPT